MTEVASPPPLEQAVGISAYKSRTPGLGGRIKCAPEDFVVEEVTPDGVVLEVGVDSPGREEPAEYTVFTLEKKNWDTMRAVKEVAKRAGGSGKRFSYAGTKDKRAVSTQRVSAWSVPVEKLRKLRIKDIELRSFGYSDSPVELGALSGNRFTVTVRGIDSSASEVSERIKKISGELADGFPNYYGLQRFGITRPITHLVGEKIVFGDFEGAVLTYLSEVYPGEEEVSLSARKKLRDEGDFPEALKYYPKNLGFELALLNHLVERPGDYVGALSRLPKNLQLMFVHAYQSYIFNRALGEYLVSGSHVERLPLVGFETSPDSVTEKILKEEGVSPADFRIKGAPELGSSGTLRECFEFAEGFELLRVFEDGSNPGSRAAAFRFTLQPGVYATMFLREFLKNEYWVLDF
jgi:tRNA pseudouridine13 synthase